MARNQRALGARRRLGTVVLVTFCGLVSSLPGSSAGATTAWFLKTNASGMGIVSVGSRDLGLRDGSPICRYALGKERRTGDRPGLLSGLARENRTSSDSTTARPLYRRPWFIAGAAGVAAVAAILLTSSDDKKGGTSIDAGTLPGFPPPPMHVNLLGVPAAERGRSH
jgi:hypothetical protein